MREGRTEKGGGSQCRPEVEMNDCENLLRAKPQPAGVQIDRTDTDTGVCATPATHWVSIASWEID